MTRTEHLLTLLAEEACEVAHRAAKALRFGLAEVQPGQDKTNAERVADELADLLTVAAMLKAAGRLPARPLREAMAEHDAKKARVEEYLAYSAACGTLTAEEPAPPAGTCGCCRVGDHTYCIRASFADDRKCDCGHCWGVDGYRRRRAPAAPAATHQVVDFGPGPEDATRGHPCEGTEAECVAWLAANGRERADGRPRYALQEIPPG